MKKIIVENAVGYKVRLITDPNIEKIFNKYFGVSRYAYNFAVRFYEKRRYMNTVNQVPFETLTNELTKHKNENANWLSEYDIYSVRMGLKDCHNVINLYLDPNRPNRFPNIKKKRSYTKNKMFAIRGDRLTINNGYARIPSIGKVKIDEKTPSKLFGHGNKEAFTLPTRYIKYINPRIIYDGLNYYLTFSIEEDVKNDITLNSQKRFKYNKSWIEKRSSDIIGIDFGCAEDKWLVTSDNDRLIRPSFKKEKKRIKKLNRKFQRQLKVNDARWEKTNPSCPANRRPRTKNEIKTLKLWNKVESKIHDKKLTLFHQFVCDNILSKKPETVVIEDLYMSNMLITDNNISKKHRSNHNQLVHDSMPSTIKWKLYNIVARNDISIIIADKEFPSTKMCSKCGHITDVGKKRKYKCPVCGMTLDRDLNAAINLSNYGYQQSVRNIS